MAHISLGEAALRSGVTCQTLEEWANRGLLTFHGRPLLSPVPPGSGGSTEEEKWVDEEELERVIESLGWLHLSAQGWEETEDE
jgi:hypothetical protein